jgi:hypothetical protein
MKLLTTTAISDGSMIKFKPNTAGEPESVILQLRDGTEVTIFADGSWHSEDHHALWRTEN